MLVQNQLSFHNAVAVDVSSADQDFAPTLRGILLDTAGTVTVDLDGGTENIALPLQAGLTAAAITKVYQTGTDEAIRSSMVGVY